MSKIGCKILPSGAFFIFPGHREPADRGQDYKKEVPHQPLYTFRIEQIPRPHSQIAAAADSPRDYSEINSH